LRRDPTADPAVRAAYLRERPIRVAIRVADRALRERTARILREAGEFTCGDAAEADVTIADRSGEFAGPVIALASRAAAATWRCDVRAALPADVDAAVLGAIITVIAAGLSVAPRRGSGELAGGRTGSWAEVLDRAAAEDEESAVILTPREREVLTLLAAGASNKAIARALGLSVHTAKFHVASLTEKLGASGRLEAVAIAIRTGLIMV
jgi:two-component system, NarL family, nitrate/nitrite response regulator NarL